MVSLILLTGLIKKQKYKKRIPYQIKQVLDKTSIQIYNDNVITQDGTPSVTAAL